MTRKIALLLSVLVVVTATIWPVVKRHADFAADGLATPALAADVAAKAPPARPVMAAPEDGRLGFAVTTFYYAMLPTKQACPSGLNPRPSADDYIDRQPEAQRDELRKPENRKRVQAAMLEIGPGGENVCHHPDLTPSDDRMVVSSSTHNVGLDLDGRQVGEQVKGGTNCAEEAGYVAPTGETGIDNQLGRILNCTPGQGPDGFWGPLFNGALGDGEYTILIDITGVDDMLNDPDVTIGIYGGRDPVRRAGAGFVFDTSMRVSPDKNLQARFKGRIVDGHIETTEAKDIMLPNFAQMGPHFFQKARLSLTVLPDRTAKGYLGAYLDIKRVHSNGGGDGRAAQLFGYRCSQMYNALRTYADGNPDPKTGQCRSISVAYDISAIPAFVIRPEATRAAR